MSLSLGLRGVGSPGGRRVLLQELLRLPLSGDIKGAGPLRTGRPSSRARGPSQAQSEALPKPQTQPLSLSAALAPGQSLTALPGHPIPRPLRPAYSSRARHAAKWTRPLRSSPLQVTGRSTAGGKG